MFSLQRLLGQEDKFFDLLEASAEQARCSARALVKLGKNPDQAELLNEFIESRRKDKKITAEISEAICTTFVTALEREDIEALSNALYKIPKTVEKIAERLLLTPQQVRGADFSKQTGILEETTDTVFAMVKALRQGANLEQMKVLNDKLQKLEGEADKMHLELLRDLYSGRYEPLQVVVLKDLYELLEKGIDRCRDAGTVISHIVLKNS